MGRRPNPPPTGGDRGSRALAYTAEARYAGQAWQLTLPLALSRIADAATLADVVEAFHQLHERLYPVRAAADPVEFTGWNLFGIGRSERGTTVAPRQGMTETAPGRLAARSVLLPEHGAS